MFIKQLRIVGVVLAGYLFIMPPLMAEKDLDMIVSFDDEEVEVRINGEIDYWSIAKLGKMPITILEKDSSNFVRIKIADKKMVWVSLSYVTTNQQAALKKNCQSQQISMVESKKQFGARGIGESCE